MIRITKMRISSSSLCFFSLLSLLFIVSTSTSNSTSSPHDKFIQCLSLTHPSVPILVENSRNNSAYTAAFLSHARNSRFLSANETRPEVIVNPTQESHVQTAVVCARKYNLDIKVRSGGHDVEGLSYASETPYIMIDLYDYKNITVDIQDNSAWIQAGAQLGEVYYRIAEKSKTHGFPAGFCPTVGVGGHISGGGFGALVRAYGLASDQVIDARIVTVDGRILNRRTMGKDLYWAIRGGGANNFGIILSWKVKLIEVTPIVTVASIEKTLEQGATDLVHRWQYIADRLPKDLYVGVTITTNTTNGKKTVQASFSILFLGLTDKLVQLMDESFPELGLKPKDCIEMSWVESHVYFYARGRPLNVLLDRDPTQKTFMKAKSDFVKEPITKAGLEGIWKRFLNDVEIPVMLWTPFGGRMNEISETENPFPHRVGNIYNILYIATWIDGKNSERNLDWLRRLYKYMTPYVTKSPRASYLNYKDLDLGQFKNGEVMTYGKAKAWGSKYFLGNFNRLVKVKSMVDPDNFFNNKQSIPPVKAWGMKW